MESRVHRGRRRSGLEFNLDDLRDRKRACHSPQDDSRVIRRGRRRSGVEFNLDYLRDRNSHEEDDPRDNVRTCRDQPGDVEQRELEFDKPEYEPDPEAEISDDDSFQDDFNSISDEEREDAELDLLIHAQLESSTLTAAPVLESAPSAPHLVQGQHYHRLLDVPETKATAKVTATVFGQMMLRE